MMDNEGVAGVPQMDMQEIITRQMKNELFSCMLHFGQFTRNMTYDDPLVRQLVK